MNKVLSQLMIVAVATANITTITNYPAIADTVNTSGTDYIFLITSDWHNCQQIGAAYQEVHAFETPSFYVNICQNGDRFFYSGEAKQSTINSVFLPAYPLTNGRGYQANNGNVSYLILVPSKGINANGSQIVDQGATKINPELTEKLLTVERNGKTILVESALKQANSCPQLNYPLALNTNPELNYDSKQIDTIPERLKLTRNSYIQSDSILNSPPEVFDLDSRFDFYTVDGELKQLTTCS